MDKIKLLQRVMKWLKLRPAEVIYELQRVTFEQPYPIIYEDGTVSNFIDPNKKAIALQIKPEVLLGLEHLRGKLTKEEAETICNSLSQENIDWEPGLFYTFYVAVEPEREKIDTQLKLMGYEVLKPLESLCGRVNGPVKGYVYPMLKHIPYQSMPLKVLFDKADWSFYRLDKEPLAVELENGDIAVWKFPQKMSLADGLKACANLKKGGQDWELCDYFALHYLYKRYEELKRTFDLLELPMLPDDDLYWTDSNDLMDTDCQGLVCTGLKRAVKLSTGEVFGRDPQEKHYVLPYLKGSKDKKMSIKSLL